MDAELSRADRARLNEVLGTWRAWALPLGEEPRPVRRLPGESNLNLLVRAPGPEGDVLLAVRLDRPATHLGVDRAVEGRVLERIRDRPWAPRVVHRQPGRCLVTRFEAGPALAGHDAPERAGHLLASIHGVDGSDLPRLDPGAHGKAYLAALPDPLRPAAEPAVAALARAMDEPGTGEPAGDPVLAHVDFQAANVVLAPRGTVVLDWEYARRAEPAWDLAVFASVGGLEPSAFDRLVAAYGAAGGRVDVARVRRLLRVYGLIEHLWWALRRPERTDRVVFTRGCESYREALLRGPPAHPPPGPGGTPNRC